MIHPTPYEGARAVSWLFLATFLGSCFWFWWLISLIYREILHIDDPVTNETLGLSFLAAGCFAIGMLIHRPQPRPSSFATATLDRCEALSYKATLLLFPPAMALAVGFAIASVGKAYAQGGQILFADQAIYYLHLFFGFMFLGVAKASQGARRKVWLAVLLLLLPRLVVSLQFGRVFLAQGVVPILLIAVARSFVRLSLRRVLQFSLLGLFILVVPSVTRGDPVFSPGDVDAADPNVPQVVAWISAGSSLLVTQDYLDLDLSHRCPPLLVSLTAKVVPYSLLDLCTIEVRGQEFAANVDRIVSDRIRQSLGLAADDISGAGTSFLLELYLTGGIAAVVVGSVAFGFVCQLMTTSMAVRSLFSGIWAECLMRAAFAPRAMLGYVFEKVPALVVITLLIALLWGEPSESRTRPSSALSRA